VLTLDSWADELEAYLKILQNAAAEAQFHKGGGEVLSKIFGSPQGIFIESLRKIYSEFSGRRPGRSVNSDGELDGPFPRFVRRTAIQWGLPVPAAKTISRHLCHKP
jgi:hypothetical protein